MVTLEAPAHPVIGVLLLVAAIIVLVVVEQVVVRRIRTRGRRRSS